MEIEFFRSVLFHMKIRVCLKYFVHDCSEVKKSKKEIQSSGYIPDIIAVGSCNSFSTTF